MISRNGIATISQYLCFKNGYTEEELKLNGLKQVFDDQKFDNSRKKDLYHNVKNKVISNSGPVADKGAYPQSQKINEIREAIGAQKELEKKLNQWPGQGYEYVENVLFEKGPYGNKKNKAIVEAEEHVNKKELTATQQL